MGTAYGGEDLGQVKFLFDNYFKCLRLQIFRKNNPEAVGSILSKFQNKVWEFVRRAWSRVTAGTCCLASELVPGKSNAKGCRPWTPCRLDGERASPKQAKPSHPKNLNQPCANDHTLKPKISLNNAPTTTTWNPKSNSTTFHQPQLETRNLIQPRSDNHNLKSQI